MESKDIDMVVAALRKVPEQKLLLIEIANRVGVKRGELDYFELAKIQPEVNLALSEAKAYAAQTAAATMALIGLGARE